MSKREYPSVEYVRQCVSYEDGRLFWLKRPREHFPDDRSWNHWNSKFSGKEAGWLGGKSGRRRWQICIDQFSMYRHIVVWAIHRGEWLIGIDHEDRDKSNDRIENLRPASATQNGGNRTRGRNNTSGYKGVSYDRGTRKWIARICVQRRSIRLGYFDSPEQAHIAYHKAARVHFGEFACDG